MKNPIIKEIGQIYHLIFEPGKLSHFNIVKSNFFRLSLSHNKNIFLHCELLQLPFNTGSDPLIHIWLQSPFKLSKIIVIIKIN